MGELMQRSECELARRIEDLPTAYNAAVDLLETNLQRGRGDKVAYIDRSGSWTYSALSDRVDRVVGLLQQFGVRREDRVLLCLLDTADFPAVFLGAIKAGVVPVPVNTLFTSDVYAYQLNDSRAKIAFVSESCVSKFDPIRASCPDLIAVVVTGAGDDGLHLDTLLAQAPAIHAAADTHRDEPAFWLYTSGSTGPPKGVVHAHGSLRLTANLYGTPVVGIGQTDVVFSVAKLFFAYGLGNALTFPLAAGATTVLLDDRPTPVGVFEILRSHEVTILGGSPTFFAGLLDHPAAYSKAQLPTLRTAMSAGEALPASLAERFLERFGVQILDGLGSTEMLHIFISQHPDSPKFGVTGKPIAGYVVRLVDDEGLEVAPGQIGELQVRGPTAALGYWNNLPKTRHTFLGEWLRTGDKYVEDEEGFYRYAGRSDDMLKVSGIYVSPFDVEEALVGHPGVLEAAVVGWVDASGLIKPKAFVIRSTLTSVTNDELEIILRAHVKQCVAPHAYPRWIEFVDELPKTATGKIQRFKLRHPA
jgi:benzoate-CoA ligase